MNATTAVKMMALLMLLAGAAAAGLKYMAVVETDMDAQSGASESLNPAEVRQITAELRRQATENLPPERYSVMTSETVQSMGGAVLEECVDENCVITLGSKIGADYIVRGIISKFGTKLTLLIELYETDNGMLVISSEPVRSENKVELLEMATAACANMYKKFAGAKVATRKSTPQPKEKPQYTHQETSQVQTRVNGRGARFIINKPDPIPKEKPQYTQETSPVQTRVNGRGARFIINKPNPKSEEKSQYTQETSPVQTRVNGRGARFIINKSEE